jgi:hypothetical protein
VKRGLVPEHVRHFTAGALTGSSRMSAMRPSWTAKCSASKCRATGTVAAAAQAPWLCALSRHLAFRRAPDLG